MRRLYPLALAMLALVTGCSGKLQEITPEDIGKIEALAGIAERVAKEHGIAYRIELNLNPVEFYLKQAAGASGIDARLIMFGNAQDQTTGEAETDDNG